MSDRPDLSKRRTIVPAPDEGVDPIDSHKDAAGDSSPTPAKEAFIAAPTRSLGGGRPVLKQPTKSAEAELPPRDLNLQVTSEVMETIDFAKFKTKLTKREIVQRAVLEYWSEYRPTENKE